jgi:protocatechuate 3,4-dioxygenase beta subunit
MKRRALLLQGSAFLTSLAVGKDATEPVLGGACEGCELVFVDMPRNPASRARIAPAGAAGTPMVIEGTVRRLKGGVAAGVVVYAYHTDAGGIYPRAATRHGALRGWAVTDAAGNYRFDTIRPGAYPGNEIPQHVHMHVIEPGKGTYYIDELRFTDDPYVTERNRRTDERGGNGLVTPERRGDSWYARRDIVLGMNIPGYA